MIEAEIRTHAMQVTFLELCGFRPSILASPEL